MRKVLTLFTLFSLILARIRKVDVVIHAAESFQYWIGGRWYEGLSVEQHKNPENHYIIASLNVDDEIPEYREIVVGARLAVSNQYSVLGMGRTGFFTATIFVDDAPYRNFIQRFRTFGFIGQTGPLYGQWRVTESIPADDDWLRDPEFDDSHWYKGIACTRQIPPQVQEIIYFNDARPQSMLLGTCDKPGVYYFRTVLVLNRPIKTDL